MSTKPTMAAETPSARRAPLLMAAVMVGACLAVYWNSLGVPFLFDDGPAILRNESIRRLWPLSGVLQPPLEGAGVTGRPLVNLSLAVNYALGGVEVRGYHLMNLALHTLATLALWGVLRRTLRRPVVAPNGQGNAGLFAGSVALLWAVHPLLTESVVCVIQRNEIMGGLFYLLTMYGFIRATEKPETGNLKPEAQTPARSWQAVAVLACLLGMASKETMATAPLLVFLYDRTFVAGSFQEAWRQRKGFYLLLASTWLLLAGLMLGSNQRAGIAGFGLGVSPWEYLLTQCRALTIYLQLAVWPHPLVLDYGTTVVRSAGEVWVQGLVVVSLLLVTGWALWRRPMAGFVGACFFVLLAPSSSFVPLTTQPIAEHRMYLPLAAVLVLAVAAIQRLSGRRGWQVAVALLVVALGVTTVRRNEVYRDEARLWNDLITRQPLNARAYASLGHYLVRQERWTEAIAPYEQALRLRPDYADAQSDYASVLSRVGRLTEAIPHFEDALRLKPGDEVIQYNLGLALAAAGRRQEAQANLEAVLRRNPTRATAALHCNLGNVLLDLGEVAEAAVEFSRALELQPDYTEAHHNLALALVRLDRPAEAVPHYLEALRRLPDSALVHQNLAIALEKSGRVDEAIVQDEAALRLEPGFAAAREHLARLRGK